MNSLERQLASLRADVAELRRRMSRLPVRFGFSAPAAGGGGIDLMQCVGEEDEYLLCRRLDDEGEPITEGEPIKVAKPYWFRRSSYDGLVLDGFTYAHTGAGQRTATAGSYVLTEEVSPTWVQSGMVGTVATIKVATMEHTHVEVDDEELTMEAIVEGRDWVSTVPFEA